VTQRGRQRGGLLEAQTVLTVEVINAAGVSAAYFQSPILLRALNYAVAADNPNSAMIQNFFVRPAVVGLVSNTSNATLLGGLTTADNSFPVGSTVQLLFTNDVVADFVRKSSTANQSSPFIVRPYDYNASSNPYQWILKQVAKGGQPCTWDADLPGFTYLATVGTANSVALAVDQTGFSLPA
jgi:hypothetical protein